MSRLNAIQALSTRPPSRGKRRAATFFFYRESLFSFCASARLSSRETQGSARVGPSGVPRAHKKRKEFDNKTLICEHESCESTPASAVTCSYVCMYVGHARRTENTPPFMPDPGHASLGGELGRPPPGPQLARWARVRASIRGPWLSSRWARPTWRSTAHRSVLLAHIARSLCNRNARGCAWRVCRSAATSVD